MKTSARQHGFTMVEITVVLLILGIAAGAVALNVRNPMRKAAMADVVDRIVQFDATVRAATLRQGRGLQVMVDLSAGRLACVEASGESGGPAVALPGTFRIERVVTPLQTSDTGQVALRYGAQGQGSSYGLLVSGPAGRTWILVLGLTGQVVETDDEQTVVDILGASGGLHAG